METLEASFDRYHVVDKDLKVAVMNMMKETGLKK
jgi:hypothetical protein